MHRSLARSLARSYRRRKRITGGVTSLQLLARLRFARKMRSAEKTGPGKYKKKKRVKRKSARSRISPRIPTQLRSFPDGNFSRKLAGRGGKGRGKGSTHACNLRAASLSAAGVDRVERVTMIARCRLLRLKDCRIGFSRGKDERAKRSESWNLPAPSLPPPRRSDRSRATWRRVGEASRFIFYSLLLPSLSLRVDLWRIFLTLEH